MGVAGRAPSEALGEGPSSLCQPPAAATLGASLGSQPHPSRLCFRPHRASRPGAHAPLFTRTVSTGWGSISAQFDFILSNSICRDYF